MKAYPPRPLTYKLRTVCHGRINSAEWGQGYLSRDALP